MIFVFRNISTFAMCDLRYYDYETYLKRTQKELLNTKNDYLLTQESMENVQKTRRLFASAYGCKASRSFLIWSLSAAMSISVAPMMAEVSADVRNFGTQLVTQVKRVTGTIIDETGEPMIGVSVLVQGTTTGTVTDLDGKFVLEIPANATLVISYIGYKTQNIKVGSQHAFAIKMESDNEVLDEVVVIGYQTLNEGFDRFSCFCQW